MPRWTEDQLARIGGADELRITARRPDGSLPGAVPIWVVRVGDDLYVRSYRGDAGRWFRNAVTTHEGRISAGGVDRDVTFEEPDDSVAAAIDDAYRTKYARYGNTYVRPMTAPPAVATTLRLLPR